MKNHPSFFILAVVVMVFPAVILRAETNKPAALILPPADWDVGKHRLVKLVATNQPGSYPLPLAWSGMEKVTARTGRYATKDAKMEQTNQWLEFDKFTVGRGSATPKLRDERFISKGEQGYGQATYRVSLPSDAELTRIRDVSSVINFWGWNPFSDGTNFPGQAPGIRLFTLGPYDSIETLQVTFMRRGREEMIDGILVKRSRLYPQPGNP